MTQEEQWLLQEKYNGKRTERFFADVKLLKNGAPLAYLIGSVPFLNCTIHLDSHPLIPRTETEYWSEKAILEIKNFFAQGYPRQMPRVTLGRVKVLDLCAGSGAIGVAVAKAIPQACVDFAEIDPIHLPTIQKNIKCNLSKPFIRMKGFESDLFENISETYDFILTNPPYIDPAVDRAEASVKLNEPQLALYGGTAGMELIAKIIAEAPAYLTPDGQLWIEHEPEQTDTITILAAQQHFQCSTHNDQYNTERYSVLTRTTLE